MALGPSATCVGKWDCECPTRESPWPPGRSGTPWCAAPPSLRGLPRGGVLDHRDRTAPERRCSSSSCYSCPTGKLVMGPLPRGWGGQKLMKKQVLRKNSPHQSSLPLPAPSLNATTRRVSDVSHELVGSQPPPRLQVKRGTQGHLSRKRPIMTQGDTCHDTGRSN